MSFGFDAWSSDTTAGDLAVPLPGRGASDVQAMCCTLCPALQCNHSAVPHQSVESVALESHAACREDHRRLRKQCDMPVDFLITGFSAFHQVDCNPTEVLVQRLRSLHEKGAAGLEGVWPLCIG